MRKRSRWYKTPHSYAPDRIARGHWLFLTRQFKIESCGRFAIYVGYARKVEMKAVKTHRHANWLDARQQSVPGAKADSWRASAF